MSEYSQLEFNWWKDKVENPSAVKPLLSDQEEDQITSWLCFPSDDSNQENTILDFNNEQMMVGLNDETCVMMPRAVEVEIVVPSAPMVKINNAALISEEMTPGTSHAARAKKKAKEKEALKSGCQVTELGSGDKNKDIVDHFECILPKKLRPPEVHRLTVRKRRDKINKKIKALQELIPRCSKLDKASTLDKAIGYMKDLQMLVQMMSIGYGMQMQMFPGMVRPCMPPMSMFTDMNVPALQAIHADMNPGRMCLGPGMIPLAPALAYQAPRVQMPYQHNMASRMLQFPQCGDPRAFPFVMQGNFQM